MMPFLRGLVFTIYFYGMIPVWGLIYLPWAFFDRRGAWAAVVSFSKMARVAARVLVGIRTEVRGPIPKGEVIIASKHQSFLDILMLVSVLDRPKFIMKQSLVWAPVLGYYAARMGCIPVERGKRGEAIKRMLADVSSGKSPKGQLIIFPQGTRVPVGQDRPYKVGTFALYKQIEQTVVPVGAHVGHLWPRLGISKRPGLAVVEFLEPINVGQDQEPFMARLENDIETASNKLRREIGDGR